MKRSKFLENKEPVCLGTIKLSPGGPVLTDPEVWRLIFKSRKNSLDFLGQVKIRSDFPSVSVEVFNENYYSLFPNSPAQVRLAMERKILDCLGADGLLPDPWQQAVRVLSEGAKGLPVSRQLSLLPEKDADLQKMYQSLNNEYFDGKIEASVIWGRDFGGHNKSGFRFGSYDGEKKCIRIHPRLKQDFVPSCVLELTLYHEMCHQWAPPVRKNGMWRSHHPAFKEKERQYRYFEQAKRWEKKHWRKLLKPAIK